MQKHMTVEEVATRLNIDNRTVRRWCESGKLTAQRVGKGAHAIWLIDPASIEGVKRDKRGMPPKK